ncbi:serine/threonine-protein kinase Nek1-like isoform X2 [Mya arenaria]|uniref:serine/threonine-protein kinase Nek1-like isoform X2 n=1 Tax=Mya arenaria TaxID=6604 RepID=UPI0022E14759|nr:serine/threonine-protein kinase Nek1-like isoform X2 [Mya arenaria]
MEKYVKVRKIGEGAFGKAELVKRKQDGLQMVIKEINIMRMNAKEREDSRKEVAVLAQLKHPSIVAYKESFEEHGCLFIVMDYCAGGDLYAKINSQRGIPFGEEQILDWFVQMCLAIKHIHDRKILHRDIKSQNIFLTARGLVQLGDFGIAKVLNSTVELARTCIGTPYYLSPEICENKPYNNKSDIWSLGCVLYELATLKHAFEAGNMKNLVLKIIRGSYPPLSPKYSYDLRNLVSALFKRAPRDRPSINSVLRKPFISQRVPKFLSTEELESEFSHTVMHGHKLGRALPPPPKPAARPPSASRSRPENGPGAAAGSAGKKYDPSKIYGQPVVRKSKENRAPAKRPGSAGGSRPGSAAGSRPGSAAGARPGSASGSRPGSAAGSRPSSSQGSKERLPISPSYKELQKRRQELLDREKKRRDEGRRRDEEVKRRELEKRHRDLQEKQRLARMHKAREEGWTSLIGSMESDSGKDNKREEVREPVRAAGIGGPAIGVQRPIAGPAGDQNGKAARGKYEHYNQYLDKLEQDREIRKRQEGIPPKAPVQAYMGAPKPLPAGPAHVRPLPGTPDPWRRAPQPSPVYQQYNQRGANQQQERAELVEDFISRRKAAANNKMRGQAELFGPSNPSDPRRTPTPVNKPSAGNQAGSAADARNREEQEYLEKLRQIRQQNYNERRNMQAHGDKAGAEERKKKAEALKKQAEDWAKQRQEALAKKKQDFFDRERQKREMQGRRPMAPSPAPAFPITGAVHALGVNPRVIGEAPPPQPGPGITNVLGALGGPARGVADEDQDRAKTPMQKQKESILKKLNEKGPPKEEAPESARPRWGEGGPGLKFAEKPETMEVARPQWGGGGVGLKLAEKPDTPDPARPQWGNAPSLDLAQMALEETSSQMEATSARDRVIMNPDSVRRQWGRPGETVVKALQGVPLAEQTMASDKSEGSLSSASTGEGPTPSAAIGSTITITKAPAITKGTITIRTAEENKKQATESELQPPTSTEDDDRLSTIPETASSQLDSPTKGRSPTRSPTQAPTVTSLVGKTVDNIVAEPENQKKDSEQIVESHVEADEKKDSPTKEVVKPPIPARKPPLPEKPVTLPKPVLLPKPDAPMEFAPSRPSSVKSLGAGTFFEKVNEETDQAEKKPIDQSKKPEDDVVVKELSDEGEKRKTGLVLGMTMGSFDIGHRELLRTCSEPDLAGLFRTMTQESPVKPRAQSLEDMTTVEEEEGEDDENIENVYSNMERAVESAEASQEIEGEDMGGAGDGNKGGESGQGETEGEGAEQEEDGENFEDDEDEDMADLISVRATMQSLLCDDSEEDSKKSPVKFSLSSDREGNDGDLDTEEDTPDGAGLSGEGVDDTGEGEDMEGDGEEISGEEGDQDAEDGDIEDDDGEEENGSGGDANRSDSVDNENPETPDGSRDDGMSELFPTDDSDSEFNDEEDMGDFDLFGRLEETRAQLEEALGADKLIQVYKTIQALQEDEDENMEEGARIAQDLLGPSHIHLYPKVFQLVMADAAFTDDNIS